MRIISQDGSIDINYKTSNLFVVGTEIHQSNIILDGVYMTLGKYATHERALEVMKEISKSSFPTPLVLKVPLKNISEERLEDIQKQLNDPKRASLIIDKDIDFYPLLQRFIMPKE